MDSYKSLDDELIEQFEISELYKDEEVDRETLKEMESISIIRILLMDLIFKERAQVETIKMPPN